VKRVQVEWVDSMADGGWSDREDAIRRAENPDVMNVSSVGYLVAEADDRLLLASSFGPHADIVQGCVQIPSAAVREVKELRR
jgi:hypothetical protein